MSLAEEISSLLNPSTKSADPVDDHAEETRAKVIEKQELDQEDEASFNKKQRRFGRNNLVEVDELYQGRVISRRSLSSDVEDDEFSDSASEAVQNDDKSSEKDDEDFQHMISYGYNSANEDGMDEEIDSDEADGGNFEIMTAKHKNDPVIKAKATRNQLKLWECMLESRIKCQKLLSFGNQLPRRDMMPQFSVQKKDSVLATDAVLGSLLQKLTDLQTDLLLQNSASKNIVNSRKRNSSSLEETAEDSLQRHVALNGFRNEVLKFWYNKTRLMPKSQSFQGFDRSAISQIEDILHDKERLLKRTLLRRSEYRVLGSLPDVSDNSVEQSSQNGEEEIYDDDDFYHQLLRQLIEQKSGSGGSSNPVELTRRWLEVQRLRTKARKIVDVKASKGRKVRYEVHRKLLSFMAPNDQSVYDHDARNQLFKSLFGNSVLD